MATEEYKNSANKDRRGRGSSSSSANQYLPCSKPTIRLANEWHRGRAKHAMGWACRSDSSSPSRCSKAGLEGARKGAGKRGGRPRSGTTLISILALITGEEVVLWGGRGGGLGRRAGTIERCEGSRRMKGCEGNSRKKNGCFGFASNKNNENVETEGIRSVEPCRSVYWKKILTA